MEKIDRTPKARCVRCDCPYGSHGFHDLIVPDNIWKQISPTGDDGGLLCPTCIIAAMEDLGLKGIPVYFASGPACLEPTVSERKYARLWTEAKEKLAMIAEVLDTEATGFTP